MSAAASPTAVSSSSTLWATASKEWVIPAKPKPGRKPKKDVAPPPEETAETDSKGRRVQNRAAQRAFRERKQSQLAELQARVQQYEQGEIERNVALQNIAKRLKEENEKLRKENLELKDKVAQFEERVAQKRPRDEFCPQSPYDLTQSPAKKRNRVSIDALSNFTQTSFPPVSYASSPSAASSADSSDAHSSFSPVPMSQSARDTPIFPQTFGLNGIFELASSGKSNLFEPGGALDTFDCGLCSDNTPCFCREMALQQANDRMAAVNGVSPMKLETADQNTAATSSSPSMVPQTQTSTSILDNLPAYQAPVPLRRRAPNPSLQPIFPITLPTSEPAQPEVPSCTGDPSNCPACADDAFGKAFCAAISKSVSSSGPCNDCPGRGQGGCGGATGSGCCGNPGACGRGADAGSSSGNASGLAASGSGSGSNASAAAAPLTSSLLMSEPLTTSETIPCDAAWRQIKSHPNAVFTDLSLLAEVVARRTKCTGPTVEISPAPGTITPERGLSPGIPAYAQQQDSQPIILTDPHAQYHERQRTRTGGTSSPPQLVPQEVLVKCGRQRVREVMADGVRDALRLLDARFAVP
ncbi:uncharacterized protein TRAVEDRAFT_33223 [Trametes versicolor FP-101664 SS1]|uniref:uncharacterized protein n=1 Tax=Trametes versicolor (strain FP-101664) TaxID=717944 RepID=UPI0004623BD0|nr:uncharacterized protein TRAVEDRAFT_33223 [Trametes versicolor FP-101664 SS1]EIW64438.1 hypothetical protein TRAVEDRAFT_33223 [Trametes versicolor FP-101664 SS1]